MLSIFCHYGTLKPLTLPMDHAKLLDVLTSLPVSHAILPRALSTDRNLTILDMLGQTLTLWKGLFFYLDILYKRDIFLLVGMVKQLYAGKQNRIVNGNKNSVEGGVTVIFMSKSPEHERRSRSQCCI